MKLTKESKETILRFFIGVILTALYLLGEYYLVIKWVQPEIAAIYTFVALFILIGLLVNLNKIEFEDEDPE